MSRETPNARELRQMIADLKVDQELEWHLMFNHFPSKIADLDLAKTAIGLAKAHKGDTPVIPGITANDVIEELRLEEFVNAS